MYCFLVMSFVRYFDFEMVGIAYAFSYIIYCIMIIASSIKWAGFKFEKESGKMITLVLTSALLSISNSVIFNSEVFNLFIVAACTLYSLLKFRKFLS